MLSCGQPPWHLPANDLCWNAAGFAKACQGGCHPLASFPGNPLHSVSADSSREWVYGKVNPHDLLYPWGLGQDGLHLEDSFWALELRMQAALLIFLVLPDVSLTYSCYCQSLGNHSSLVEITVRFLPPLWTHIYYILQIKYVFNNYLFPQIYI